jgi:dTDP-4-dehydrorhamnose 3,5-epimerase
MQFTETAIHGVWVIDPDFRRDERGHFFRAWCVREFAEHSIQFAPVQANIGFNLRKGTVRGMHLQRQPASEAKLIRCTRGAMFDVAVDLRTGSPAYGRWHGVELTAENGRMMYIPEDCAHGYQALEDETEMHYMTSHVYMPELASGVRFDDPTFAIQWPLEARYISAQDRNWPLLPR